MENLANQLNLLNICKGAVPEVFERELRAVLDNIADPNTDAKAKRRITLTFEFTPFPDRQGAIVSVSTKAALGAMDSSEATGNIYMLRQDGKVSAFARDVRQELLFGKDEPQNVIPMAGKDRAAGE